MNIGELGNGVRRYFHTNPDRWLWRDGLLAFGKTTSPASTARKQLTSWKEEYHRLQNNRFIE